MSHPGDGDSEGVPLVEDGGVHGEVNFRGAKGGIKFIPDLLEIVPCTKEMLDILCLFKLLKITKKYMKK
jgi:hypothetical protein